MVRATRRHDRHNARESDQSENTIGVRLHFRRQRWRSVRPQSLLDLIDSLPPKPGKPSDILENESRSHLGTIALSIIAQNGIVFAADTEETWGDEVRTELAALVNVRIEEDAHWGSIYAVPTLRHRWGRLR